jgi:ribonuclease T2
MRLKLVFAFAFVLSACSYSPSFLAQQRAQPGNFDFYVFTLSWSPEFCAMTGNQKAECHVHGNSFVVHGLWPQFKNGSWPSKCSNQPGPANPASEADVMGDPTLVEHEWQVHGTCSGLSVDQYFQTIRSARQGVKIPPVLQKLTQPTQMVPADIKSAFLASNPQLNSSEIAVGCANNTLSQVQICLAKSGSPMACSGVRDCRAPSIKVLPAIQ